ncbi:helix-turn-helix transcriptional regulator [Dyella tabacisoli]|uniref:YafY family transcriptional regulator n=1 Tax=Dyella tabacisoli TaxID=2282381 RepID=A0A369UQH6_9GAMM|nr:YafY family protein [Dyella tabacisoli]RDD83024.1 YafY family transcriptional regulator [Dyella tabacisoli]
MALPTTRVLAVLELLQSHGRISGPELARRVNVDVRTLRRYIVILEELGIPITTERGRYGAYMLVAGFKLPPMMFTDDEALALSVGLLAARSLGLAEAAPAVESAQAKLIRVMPEKLQRQVHAIEETVKIHFAGATNTPSSNAALITLTTAAQAQQRVYMRYESGQHQHTEREFDPYGLAFRTGAWYTVGMCHLRKDLRSFRLDRIEDIKLLEQRFQRPPGFDPLEQLAFSIASLPRSHAIEVLLRTDLKTARKAFSLAFGLFEHTADGVLLRSSADDLNWFARQLAALSFDFIVHSPPELRNELKTLSTRLQTLAKTSRT